MAMASWKVLVSAFAGMWLRNEDMFEWRSVGNSVLPQEWLRVANLTGGSFEPRQSRTERSVRPASFGGQSSMRRVGLELGVDECDTGAKLSGR